MKILTFDIEEWYIEKAYYGGRKDKYQEYDRYLNSILDILEEQKIKATFFCIGKIAPNFPEVIRKIADKGHEIGCHSDEHIWLNKMKPSAVREDTIEAVKSLQDVSGQPVISYRAPAFSIGEQNKWVFEVLYECGIRRDASVFPMTRDFGGFSSFPSRTPTIVEYNGIQIKEFPICSTKLFGKEVAYSGGGYFRFFPLWLLKNKMKNNKYVMTYFHIGDLIHNKGGIMSKTDYETYFKEKGSFFNRLKRYAKSNIGTSNAFEKMTHLIKQFNFINLEKADSLIDWGSSECVIL
ncbi:MAG: polysaccharide deacetylase family protein [Lentimicrobiaceae bacterium]|nr:polysaccharide deacetylase family protein [Lentimicrobiaceae bacterium]